MTLDDIKFTLHNDMSADDIDIVNNHNNLIKQSRYSDATNSLDSNNYQKGFRASLFNYIEEKLHILEAYLLNLQASDDEYYSFIEPSESEMEGKKYWIQIYN